MNLGSRVSAAKQMVPFGSLSYDLVKKNAKFFINGEFDSEMSFAGNLPFPVSDGFRLRVRPMTARFHRPRENR